MNIQEKRLIYVLWALSLASLFLFVSPSQANENNQAVEVEVNGQKVRLSDPEYYSTGEVFAGRAVGEYEFEMIRGNKVKITGHFIDLSRDGQLLAVRNLGLLKWTFGNGAEVELNCATYSDGSQTRNQTVYFHGNKEYSKGCYVNEAAVFETSYYKIYLTPGYSDISLKKDGELESATELSALSKIKMPNGAEANLMSGSNAAFYEDNSPYFFTIHPKSKLKMSLNGVVKSAVFGTHPRDPTALMLQNNGLPMMGGLIKSLKIELLGHQLDLSVEAARFHPTGEMGLMVLSHNAVLPEDVKKKAFALPRGKRGLCLDVQGQLIGLQQCGEQVQ